MDHVLCFFLFPFASCVTCFPCFLLPCLFLSPLSDYLPGPSVFCVCCFILSVFLLVHLFLLLCFSLPSLPVIPHLGLWGCFPVLCVPSHVPLIMELGFLCTFTCTVWFRSLVPLHPLHLGSSSFQIVMEQTSQTQQRTPPPPPLCFCPLYYLWT